MDDLEKLRGLIGTPVLELNFQLLKEGRLGSILSPEAEAVLKKQYVERELLKHKERKKVFRLRGAKVHLDDIATGPLGEPKIETHRVRCPYCRTSRMPFKSASTEFIMETAYWSDPESGWGVEHFRTVCAGCRREYRIELAFDM